ncbi:outer membrane beta-barrel family protein [Croceitalea sp. MTPC9]|uniref:outer membrane beta-barrel family protein n=1 Tax=unclassified Croceitalea TaxID=2632280 RepID=UPI002B3AAD97|nr:outer membrane beta-barrel family protein [Croceitalea sp. MTPC6]GMN17513.1 outer membrane beta-barrel family protein [Croceitalea sp. MTPC9]
MRLAALIFLLISSAISAQEYFKIEGEVYDENGNIVSIGDVLLLKIEDKTLVKYMTLIEGNFLFENIPNGDYVIQINVLGFESFEENLVLNKNTILSIALSESTIQLNEVEVVAAKNPIAYEAGNLKVDVQNQYFSSIPDPVDLMSRLPGVQISADRESISIMGKGNPLIYLGNQRISMEEFTALAIDGIATIEIINNPSAKYEADGRAVLLVKLKKMAQSGFQGSLQETASQKRNFNNYLTFNSSYSKKSWTLRGNLAYNQLQQWESNSFLFEIPEREVSVDYLVLIPKNIRVQLNGGFGAYLQWNDTDYVSLNASARLQTDDAPFFTDTFIMDREDEEFIRTNTNNDNSKDYYSASFNFNKKLSNSWNLFSGAQYSGFRQVLDTEIQNNINNSSFALDQTREQEYSINSLAFRLDVEKDISKSVKWESGINISRAKADAFTEIVEPLVNEETFIDFKYDEDLYAVYSTVSGKIGKKNNFEMGMRIEHNEVNGEVATEDSPVISRSNTNLFPKANLSITIDSTQTLNLNYARSIQRPDFSRASSITVFINPFLEGSGNVNLRPTLTNEISVNYQKGNKSLFFNYYQNQNPTNFTIAYDTQNDTGVLSLVNLEKERGFYAGVTLPYTKGIWTSNNTVTLNYNRLIDSRASFSSTKPYIYIYTNHQLKVAKDMTLVLCAWTLGRRQEGIFKRNGLTVFEASLSKTFLKKWDCTLRFNDITRAMNFEESYAVDGVIADGVYFGDVREIALSLKYRFGSKNNPNFKNKDVDGNIDRIK